MIERIETHSPYYSERIELLINKVNEIVDYINATNHEYKSIMDVIKKTNDRMIGCESLDIPESYKSTNDVWRTKLKIATENLQKIRKMGMGTEATPFAMGCVADLALRELDKFDKDE